MTHHFWSVICDAFIHIRYKAHRVGFILFPSLMKLQPRSRSSILGHTPAGTAVIFRRSAATHLHPQLDLESSYRSLSPPTLHCSTPSCWSIYRPCFISTPAGSQSCHSGHTEPLRNTAWEWKCTLLMQETYSCHFLSADLHGAILSWMCVSICGAKITRKWESCENRFLNIHVCTQTSWICYR